ncbi:DUF4136 domain-containing protein [Flammeovirga sp. EKP202]|uniref:DUF4136 domain-containing protein n=1 Tax=Flammeovirga sp. EKP202 TaxID=2770592 RepID=UPI00165FA995|nr:DUF4136 domain-containing protein [Flammeovirga sp. EKP202]MBD0403148.1 hypothetical protein [Flammeovirga sp. EKP202]
MKTLLLKAFMLSSLIALLQSCYPGGAEYTSDLDIAISRYESVENLRSYRSYYLVEDSIAVTSNTKDTLTLVQQLAVLANVDTQLQGILELEKVTKTELESGAKVPDLFIQLSQIAVQQSGFVWQPPYYPGYPGWGYPGWGYPGYPWYGGGYSYYSYSNGTILFDFIDVEQTTKENEGIGNDEVPTLILGWQGALNGVLSRANSVPLINEGVDVLFDQYNTAKAGTE